MILYYKTGRCSRYE